MDTEEDLLVTKHIQDQSAAEFDVAACLGHAHTFCHYLLIAVTTSLCSANAWLVASVIGWNSYQYYCVILTAMWFYIKHIMDSWTFM